MIKNITMLIFLFSLMLSVGAVKAVHAGGETGCGDYLGVILNGRIMDCVNFNLLSGPRDPSLVINRPQGANIYFREANVWLPNSQMTLSSGGSLGLGTSSPSESLEIRNPVCGGSASGQGCSTFVKIKSRDVGQYRQGSHTNIGFILEEDVIVGNAAKVYSMLTGIGRGSASTPRYILSGRVDSRYIFNSHDFFIDQTSSSVSVFTLTGTNAEIKVPLKVTGSLRVTDQISVLNATGNPAAYMVNNGTVFAQNYLLLSDRTKKKDIEPLVNALDKIEQLQGVEFKWKEDESKEIGVIAQDVEEVVPELVVTDKEGVKSVKYANMAALFIEAIKEQQHQINDLKKEIEELKKNK